MKIKHLKTNSYLLIYFQIFTSSCSRNNDFRGANQDQKSTISVEDDIDNNDSYAAATSSPSSSPLPAPAPSSSPLPAPSSGNDEWFELQINSVFVSEQKIYAATHEGLFISSDDGKTWINQTKSDGLPHNSVSKVYAQNQSLYVGTWGEGLSISSDNGNTWTSYNKSSGLGFSDYNFVQDVYVGRNGNIYVANGEAGGVSLSTNNASSWTKFNKTDGLYNDSVMGVHAIENSIYAATMQGLSISRDNGKSWTSYRRNFMDLNPNAGGVVYSIQAENLQNGRRVCAATEAGLFISDNDGELWKNLTKESNGILDNQINDLHLSGNTIYLATSKGISISQDGGKEWKNIATDSNVKVIYAVDRSIYIAKTGGIAISNNEGTDWCNIAISKGKADRSATKITNSCYE